MYSFKVTPVGRTAYFWERSAFVPIVLLMLGRSLDCTSSRLGSGLHPEMFNSAKRTSMEFAALLGKRARRGTTDRLDPEKRRRLVARDSIQWLLARAPERMKACHSPSLARCV